MKKNPVVKFTVIIVVLAMLGSVVVIGIGPFLAMQNQETINVETTSTPTEFDTSGITIEKVSDEEAQELDFEITPMESSE